MCLQESLVSKARSTLTAVTRRGGGKSGLSKGRPEHKGWGLTQTLIPANIQGMLTQNVFIPFKQVLITPEKADV